MSSTGTATVVLAPMALVGATVAMAGLAVVGAGVLCARGVMWCGRKLDENYQHNCHEWSTLVARAQAENLSRATTMATAYRVSTNDSLAAMAFLSPAKDVQTRRVQSLSTQSFLQELAQMQTVLELEKQAHAQKKHHDDSDDQRFLLAGRLQIELDAGKDILDSALLNDAEQALHGSSDTMQQVLERMLEAWETLSAQQAVELSQSRQVRYVIDVAYKQLQLVELQLKQLGKRKYQKQDQQMHLLRDELLRVEDEVKAYPQKALNRVEHVQDKIFNLKEDVNQLAFQSWAQSLTHLHQAMGHLNALEIMVQEAATTSIVPTSTIVHLADEIQKEYRLARQLLEGGDTPEISSRAHKLQNRVQQLKEKVFTAVKESQQRAIAYAVQQTLTEQGFVSVQGDPAMIKNVGRSITVSIDVDKSPDGQEKDERLIEFEVSREGEVTYTFRGYADAECLKDAQRILAALREKGIYLLNGQGESLVEHSEHVSLVTLRQEQYQEEPVQNLVQVEIAQRVKQVLVRMGFEHIHVCSNGGVLEVEAFNGQIGYRVSLGLDGEVEVHTDSSAPVSDRASQDEVVQQIYQAQLEATKKAAHEKSSQQKRRSGERQRKSRSSSKASSAINQ
ncbi:hypothetical protein KDH_12530 [Dictyobacter sp. S3.2.2.5]|uniref:Uncharacterized protein n=1 Tax=Dictyobacter halimunensis TaxID=3026934 RepID=A0ABQ6FJL7_9CHLR|nr:hypothetical protein KDH_12530 [Dictyobacter sp. S3.2.2.5]